MQKIVLGYDETDASKRALERVAQLAKAFGSEVFVSSVAPLVSSAARSGGAIDPADPPSKHVEELSHARAYLEGQGITARYQAAIGSPADTILALATEQRCGFDCRRHARAKHPRAAARPERQRDRHAQGSLRRAGRSLRSVKRREAPCRLDAPAVSVCAADRPAVLRPRKEVALVTTLAGKTVRASAIPAPLATVYIADHVWHSGALHQE